MADRLALFCALALFAAAPTLAAGPPRSALVVESSGSMSLSELAEVLEARGARITHRLPPDLLVGQLPPGLLEGPRLPEGVSLLSFSDPAARPHSRAVGAVHRFLGGATGLPGRELPLPEPLTGDTFELEPGELALPKALRDCERPSATSAFLAGSVSVGLILPESSDPPSDPNLEDWATEDPAHAGESRFDLVVAEVMEGLDFLAAQHPDAGLSFTYDLQLGVRIDREPIHWNASERMTWMRPTMDALGYEGLSPTTAVRRYVDELREAHDSDWGFAAFIMDSLNDADGAPPNGFPFAYALLGGPYMVMTYDNDGWGINRMDVVTAHETGHIFRALDEYRSAGNTCGARSGYLTVENANNDSEPGDPDCTPTPDTSCVMRAASGSVCEFTTGQLGLRDSDDNGIPDVRDAPPHSLFDEDGPLLLGVDSVLLEGDVRALSLPEESPHAPTRYTINRVAAAEWRLDAGAWQALAATDGAFGGRCERVSMDLVGLSEGWHEVELRGTNDVGLLEPSPALIRLYVNTDCADDLAEPDDSEGQARPRPAGSWPDLFHCAFDEDWSRFHLASDAAIAVELRFDTAVATLIAELRDPAGRVLASSSPTPDGAALATTAPFAGTHHLVVSGEGEDESAYELVIDAECLNDWLEPNDLAGEARLLGAGLHSDFVICAADVDRHALSVQAGESIEATLNFEHALGDLDLALLDPSGATVAESLGSADGESLMVTPTEEGVYELLVFGKGPDDQNLHELEVLVTGCPDDLRENDDEPATAWMIVAGVQRGTLCDGDEDWFAFTVGETSLVEIDLSHDLVADLDLELRDATGATLLRSSTRPSMAEDITVERLLAGDYRVRVHAPLGGSADYTLRLQVDDPVLLRVARDPSDALLSWSDAGQECYWVRRSEDVSDFSGATETLIQDGEEFVEDRNHRDRGVIFDGTTLYGYLVEPGDCGRSLLGSTKTASPYPVVVQGVGTLPGIEYTITAVNSGRDDLFGVRIEDDVPAFTEGFEVLEIPAGATDLSEPAPAGAFGAGYLVIEGVNVPAGSTAVVRFRVLVGNSASGGNVGPVIDNQGRLLVPGDDPTGVPEVFLTDDPATSAFPDDTRVHPGGFARQLQVTAFWHRDVNVDLRVIDPCGNAISVQDAMSADCMGITGSLTGSWSCGGGSWFNRAEQVTWFAWPAAAGNYSVEVAYEGSGDDSDLCRGRGEEQITVVVQSPSFGLLWRTITLEPGGGFVPVLDFEP